MTNYAKIGKTQLFFIGQRVNANLMRTKLQAKRNKIAFLKCLTFHPNIICVNYSTSLQVIKKIQATLTQPKKGLVETLANSSSTPSIHEPNTQATSRKMSKNYRKALKFYVKSM